MRKKIFRMGLSVREIDKTIAALEQYKLEIYEKAETLRNRVAERIAELSESGFSGAIVDDLLKGGVKTANVEVSVDNRDTVSLVIANGKDAVWVEFGAGVFHNGSVGSSPHPAGSELGFTIGSYGKGRGKQSTWGYYENGVLRITHGTPAVMPMYNAVKIVCDELADIAREVFR